MLYVMPGQQLEVHVAEPGDQSGTRPLVMTGGTVGLALMRAEDVPTIAQWNQDLEFTARLGTPGEAHTLEMRQEPSSRQTLHLCKAGLQQIPENVRSLRHDAEAYRRVLFLVDQAEPQCFR